MKKDLGMILGFIAIVLLIGAEGGVEVSETVPVASVVIGTISFVYLMVYIGWHVLNNDYDKEDWDAMEKDWNDEFLMFKGEKEDGEK